MNPSDQIAADLDRLASARPVTTSQRQEIAQRIVRMRKAEAGNAERAANEKQNQLHRGVVAQVDAAREYFKGDVPVELEEALREIVRLVG